jgi:hypothetical protein
MVRLDRFFINADWNLLLPDSVIASSSAPVSDHCQFLLTTTSKVPKLAILHFNNHWLRLPGSLDVIASAWASIQHRSGTGKLVLGQGGSQGSATLHLVTKGHPSQLQPRHWYVGPA